jgi:hypothetical protein
MSVAALDLAEAFPASADRTRLLQCLRSRTRPRPTKFLQLVIKSQILSIPDRIYHDPLIIHAQQLGGGKDIVKPVAGATFTSRNPRKRATRKLC